MSEYPHRPNRRRCGGWLSLALACVAMAAAPAAVAAEAEFHTRAWTTDDGLPHNSVSSIIQDTAGFMWFATVGGLARFDGREFREVLLPPEHRTAGFNIRGLAEERPGVLVVIPASNSVLRLSGSTWAVHPAHAMLTELGETPLDVHVDSTGAVWIATSSGRVLRTTPDGNSRGFGHGESMVVRGRSLSFAEDGSGTWISGNGLWFAPHGGDLQRVTPLAEMPRMIGRGRENRIWLWTDKRLCQLSQGRVVAEYDVPRRVDARGLRHLFEDSQGALWIANSRRGLFRFAQGKLERVSDFPSSSLVSEDREGNIWVATDGNGVGQLRQKCYQLFNMTSGLRQNIASSICEDPAGRVWFANRSGGLISVGPDGRPEASGLSGSRMFANVVCADAQNRIWFGGGRNGLLRWTPGSDAAPERLPEPTADLHLLFHARNGDMWFAADPRQLGYYRGDTPHLFAAAEGFPPQEIRAIAQDSAGDIWLGGRSGELLRWDGRKFQRFDTSMGFPRLPIHAIYADASRRVWIGTAGGLVLKDGERFHLLTEAHGLADNIIQHLMEDDRGFLWFAARRGMFYVAKSELLAAARGTSSARVQSHRLGADQGLVGLSPTANYSPGALKSRDGRVWFATVQGALAIDPARLARDLPPPPVLIDELRFDGKSIPLTEPLRLESGRHRVEFRLAALSYTAPESVLLRHQLEGVDGQWIDTGSDRVASYTNLSPGAYRLRAIARNSTGSWNTEGATLAFVVVPAWWETLGFRSGMVALVLVLTAWLARTIAQRRLQQRLRRLEQEHALEKERIRIARDLHDELGAGLTEVGLLADRLVEAAPRELAPQLSGLSWRTRRLATDLSGIVWTMNAKHSSLEHLALFLRRYAERLFRHTGTRCGVKGVEAIPAIPLPPGVQHQLLAAVKEALNNILKHARASEAQVELRYTDGTFEVRIADNGVGCALGSAERADGNGLRNIRSRLEEIAGSFEFVSSPGAGTQILFRVPCAAPQPAR